MTDDRSKPTGALCNGNPAYARRVILCPTEQRRRRFAVSVMAYYGTDWYCLGCGLWWSGMPTRPKERLRRGRRIEAVFRAREMWANATTWDEALKRIIE